MNIRKILGYTLLAIPFMGVFSFMTALQGILAAVAVFAISGIIAVLIIAGVYLISP